MGKTVRGGPRSVRLRAARVQRGERKKRAELGALKSVDLVAFNSSAEGGFVKLIARLAQQGSLSVASAIQEGAFELNISTETAKRYLIKHSAQRAEFVIKGSVVKLRR